MPSRWIDAYSLGRQAYAREQVSRQLTDLAIDIVAVLYFSLLRKVCLPKDHQRSQQ